jgi:hypothetical protein
MVQGAVRFRLLFLNSTAMTNTDFIKALRSKRKLLAYTKFNDDIGTYMPMVKEGFLTLANTGQIETWDATITGTSIYLG